MAQEFWDFAKLAIAWHSLRVQLSDFGEFLMKLQEARRNHQDEVTPNPNWQNLDQMWVEISNVRTREKYLERAVEMCLGVFLSSDMTWSAHVDSICSKARKPVGLLYRRFSANVDNHSLLEMYKFLIRPHKEYAAPVWSPHLVKDRDSLENVQKFALRMCHKNWDVGYQELVELSELPTLENRRLHLKLRTLYKINTPQVRDKCVHAM